jgi:peptidoglycan/LPS O-acetylase OafA/YrhL
MDKTFSSLLDLSRFFAAFLVFIHHTEQIYSDQRLSFFASFGHDAVIFFFILSGFVIGFVSDKKEKTGKAYAIARLSRLYSVALPALFITATLVWIGGHIFPESYQVHTNQNWNKILIDSVLFINQSWLGGTSVPTNGPYWSISYEAWYYIIFGTYFYLSGHKRVALTTFAIIIAGPRILVLMPIWIVGLMCYTHHHKLKTRPFFGYISIVTALFLYAVIRTNNIDDQLTLYTSSWVGGANQANAILGFSKHFLSDYIIAALFTLMFYGLYMTRKHYTRPLSKINPFVKHISSHTFSLYLLHFPILLFISNITSNTLVASVICLLAIALLSIFTEQKRANLSALLTTTFINK